MKRRKKPVWSDEGPAGGFAEAFLDAIDRLLPEAPSLSREEALRAFQEKLWARLPQVADALIELAFNAGSEAVRIKALEILTNRLMGTPKQAIELDARIPPAVLALREAVERAERLGLEVIRELELEDNNDARPEAGRLPGPGSEAQPDPGASPYHF